MSSTELVGVEPKSLRSQPLAQSQADSLHRELRKRIEGEVRFDAASRAIYATDASNYRQVPIGVVIPKTRDDVVETLAACQQYGAAYPFSRRRHEPGRPML